jgi:precorrin-2 dehydrogenase / sirohydrochlorin ferrochelatase
MGYLPIFLDVSGRNCVVVGGGEVAERKVSALLEARAEVILISPAITPALAGRAAAGQLQHLSRRYQRGDLGGAMLVFAASDDAAAHRAISVEARELGIPVNIADEPDLCTFIAPAVATRGALRIAVSTSGESPGFAARVRDDIENQIGAEYGVALEIVGSARRWLRSRVGSQSDRARIMQTLTHSDLPRLVADGDIAGVERVLKTILGAEASLAVLGISPDHLADQPTAATR